MAEFLSPKQAVLVRVQVYPHMKKLTQFLTSNTLFEAALPSVKELVDLLEKKKTDNQTINLFYGETYDEFGITIDSLKYYFILSFIHFHLEKLGFKVKSIVVQADTASLINKSAQDKELELNKQKDQRLELLEKIMKTYHLPIETKLMSDLFKSSQYQQNIKLVSKYAQSLTQDNKFFFNLEKTVLRNRIKQERQTKFKYALEAIATSMLFDIKIGPPREQFYDRAQHLMADELKLDKLGSIYLKPSYPLDQNFAFFLSNPEIEEFGLTPYKAGSNKMNDSRIILGRTTSNQLGAMISKSFESPNPDVAHPILDLFVIADMAKKLTSQNQDLPDYSQAKLLNDIEALKEKTITLVDRKILRRFKNEN